MKILVTGGAGFIGSNFVRLSIATRPNTALTVVDSLGYAGRLANLQGLEDSYSFVHGNILDTELMDSLIGQVDHVVHFAAETHNDNSLRQARPFIETNVVGTLNVIESCLRHDVKLHHVSTDEVFGDLSINSYEKFNLDSPYKPSSPYSASKAASDHLVRAWVRSFGLKATISNCSNNYGPYQHEEKFIPRMIALLAEGKKPQLYGTGHNVRDWIHVDDHNLGVWAAIDRGVSGETYLLSARTERTNFEIVQMLLELFNKPSDFIEFVDDRPGHDLRYALDPSEAEVLLDWRAKKTDLKAELQTVVEFYLSQNRGK